MKPEIEKMRLCTEEGQVWFEGKLKEEKKAVKALIKLHKMVMGFDWAGDMVACDDESLEIGFSYQREIELESGEKKITFQECFKEAWREIK